MSAWPMKVQDRTRTLNYLNSRTRGKIERPPPKYNHVKNFKHLNVEKFKSGFEQKLVCVSEVF